MKKIMKIMRSTIVHIYLFNWASYKQDHLMLASILNTLFAVLRARIAGAKSPNNVKFLRLYNINKNESNSVLS